MLNNFEEFIKSVMSQADVLDAGRGKDWEFDERNIDLPDGFMKVIKMEKKLNEEPDMEEASVVVPKGIRCSTTKTKCCKGCESKNTEKLKAEIVEAVCKELGPMLLDFGRFLQDLDDRVSDIEEFLSEEEDATEFPDAYNFGDNQIDTPMTNDLNKGLNELKEAPSASKEDAIVERAKQLHEEFKFFEGPWDNLSFQQRRKYVDLAIKELN